MIQVHLQKFQVKNYFLPASHHTHNYGNFIPSMWHQFMSFLMFIGGATLVFEVELIKIERESHSDL